MLQASSTINERTQISKAKTLQHTPKQYKWINASVFFKNIPFRLIKKICKLFSRASSDTEVMMVFLQQDQTLYHLDITNGKYIRRAGQEMRMGVERVNWGDGGEL